MTQVFFFLTWIDIYEENCRSPSLHLRFLNKDTFSLKEIGLQVSFFDRFHFWGYYVNIGGRAGAVGRLSV